MLVLVVGVNLGICARSHGLRGSLLLMMALPFWSIVPHQIFMKIREIAAYLCQSRQCRLQFSCCFSLFIVTLCYQYCCAAVVIIGDFYCCCCCCCYWLIVLVFIRAMRSSRLQANTVIIVDSSKVWVVFQMQRLYCIHTVSPIPRRSPQLHMVSSHLDHIFRL